MASKLVDLTTVPIDDLRGELRRRDFEADRIPERTLLLHLARWRTVCCEARVQGLLKMTFACTRIPGDKVAIDDSATRLYVMWLDAFMHTRDRRTPKARRLVCVRFRQVVPIVADCGKRLLEIWTLTDEAYRHEAAELLTIGGRRIARTHRNGRGDTSVGAPT